MPPAYSPAQDQWATSRGYVRGLDGYWYNPSGARVIVPNVAIDGTGSQVAPPAAPPAAPAAPAAPAGPTEKQQSARAFIEDLLRGWGLESLGGWAWEQILAGNTEMLPTLIRGTEQYKQRFAGLEQRRARGLNVMSEGEYLSLENSYRTIMRSYGIPRGAFDTQADLAEFIAGDLSPQELNDRLRVYQDAAFQAPQEVRNQLANLYGINEGGLIAYYIDPDRALPVLQQQYMAAGAASAAVRAGFTQFDRGQSERLAQLGAGATSLKEFATLAQSRELFTGLGASEVDQSAFSDYQAAEGTFGGNSTTAETIRKRAEQRVAAFSGGGGFARSAQGAIGIGSAST
jgi:hypothetical protein